MQLGSFTLSNHLFLAPMAGVTDRPFRQICRQFGAGYVVGEMVSANKDLRNSTKTMLRINHIGEPTPIAVQITGVDPQHMAEAARYNMDCGAQIIDINMGCPAKKVCSKWAGSALMQNEQLAGQILDAVVAVCQPLGVPVTLKMRTGWNNDNKNALALARIAQSAGVQMLSIHGRTREQGYKGQAEYETIASIKAAVQIPVVANGDIDSPQKAQAVLQATGADAVMIGRAAMGRPWLFHSMAHFLATGQQAPQPTLAQVRQTIQSHLHNHYAFYGEETGVRSARKHIGWYIAGLPNAQAIRAVLNKMTDAKQQWQCLDDYLAELQTQYVHLPPPKAETANKAKEEAVF